MISSPKKGHDLDKSEETPSLTSAMSNRVLPERQRLIIDKIMATGFATIEALAEELNVSGQTVRREIKRLEEMDILQRFHGGAGFTDGPVRLGFAKKTQIAHGAKAMIGQRAAREIPNGASVFLDIGSTVNEVATAFREHKGLRIFTNNLTAAMILSSQREIDVFVTGGSVRGADGSLVGDAALRGIEMFRADFAVLGFSGYESDGTLMDFDLDKVAVKRAMIRNAKRTIVVGDNSKFSKGAVVAVASFAEIDAIVTDLVPSKAIATKLAKLDVEIIATS